MKTQTLEIYEIFKSIIPEQQAREVIAYIEDARDTEKETVERKIEHLATKEDISIVRQEISNFRTDVIKWMFIFWIGQVGVTIALVMMFIQK